MNIPLKPQKGHKIAETVGLRGMFLLCREFGGTTIHIPNPSYQKRKKEDIIDMLGKGLAVKEIAALTQTTVRYVFMVKKRCRRA